MSEFPSQDVFAHRVVTSPQLSADGRRVAFLGAEKGGSKRAHVMGLGDGGPVALAATEGPVETLLQWHGERLLAIESVAWVAHEQDADLNGSPPSNVVNFLPRRLGGSGPVVGRRARLIAIPIDGGPVQVLVQGDFDVSSAELSPDGQQLAWLRTDDGTPRSLLQLWLANADGGNARRIPCELASLQGLRWSPDGKLLGLGGSRGGGDSIHRPWTYDVAADSWHGPWPDVQTEGAHRIAL